MQKCQHCDREANAKCTACQKPTCHDHLLTDDTVCFKCRRDNKQETIISS